MHLRPELRYLAAAILLRHVEGLPRNVEVRVLADGDLEPLLALRNGVLSALDHPDHYRPENEPDGFVADHLERFGLSIGIFHNDCLIAYGALGLPGPDDRNLGCLAGLAPEQLAHVAHLASAMVEPRFRGLNLHRWLTGVRIAIAGAQGRRHVYSTISPLNHASWGNLAAFAVYPSKFLKSQTAEAIPRLLLYRDLDTPSRIDMASMRLIPVAELHLEESLFDRNVKLWASLKLPEAAFAVAAPCLV